MKIAEISSEIVSNDTVERIQKANKGITEFFNYINDERPSIGAISRRYNFEEIKLRGKIITKDE